MKAVMASGEILEGEFTTVDQDNHSFGQIYGQAYGAAVSSVYLNSNSNPGVARLSGNRGTVLDCEYMVNRTGTGTGACKANNGRIYRVHF